MNHGIKKKKKNNTERKDGLVVFGAQSIMSGDDLTEEEWDAAVIVGTVPYPVLLLIV